MDLKATTEIELRTLGDQIAERLLDDILFGRIPAGTVFSQAGLCERFATSRMPIRDALLKLEHEGFVKRTTKNKVQVVQITREDVADVFDVCGYLSGLTAARAAVRVGPDEVRRLRDLNASMAASDAAKDYQQLARLNWEFHRQINLHANAPQLLAAFRGLSALIPRQFMVEISGYATLAMPEHEKIVEALESADGESARLLASEHVRAAGERLLSFLESSPDAARSLATARGG